MLSRFMYTVLHFIESIPSTKTLNTQRAVFPAWSEKKYVTGVVDPVTNVSPGEMLGTVVILSAGLVGVTLSVAVGGIHVTVAVGMPAATVWVMAGGQPMTTGIVSSTVGNKWRNIYDQWRGHRKKDFGPKN